MLCAYTIKLAQFSKGYNKLMKKIIFHIGGFPPPYGGATIKNKNINDGLSEFFVIKTFNTSRLKRKIEYIKLFYFLLKNKNNEGIVCVFDLSLFKITKLLSIFFRDSMKLITVFITGGNFPERLIINNENLNLYKNYKNIIVEIKAMELKLKDLGFNNVSTIPNLRNINFNREFYQPKNDKFKILFFSQIRSEKGIFELLRVAEKLNLDKIDFMIDIFGPVDESIKNSFENLTSCFKNVCYKGIYKINENSNIYDLMKIYDVLVFPTQYKGEGFPGILSEAKIAGIPVIATNFKYNNEIVHHNVDGLLIETEDIELNLNEAVLFLINNKEKRNEMRKKSFESGNAYIQNNHIQKIIDLIILKS